MAQLAEQRAQRETFAELERRLEGLEHLVTERLTELSRLLRSGEVELRLELLEEEFAQRFSRLEAALKGEVEGLKGEVEGRLEAIGQSMGERLGRVEEAVRADTVSPRLLELEQQISERMGTLEGLVGTGELSVAQRLGLLEEKVVSDDVVPRLAAAERQLTERLIGLEDSLAGGTDVGGRLAALEATLEQRFGNLEEQVRSDDIGQRLKSLELTVDERSSRLEEFVRTTDVEQRLETLTQSVEQGLDDLKAGLPAVAAAAAGGGVDDQRLAALDQAVSYRLTGLEGSFRQLEGLIATKLDAIAEASVAAEAGILERIIVESQVVGAHFQAVRPVVEAMATAGPDLEAALVELRRLAETARTPAEQPSNYHGAQIEHREGDEEDTVFLPPEETPIPDRRFGGIIPRRDR